MGGESSKPSVSSSKPSESSVASVVGALEATGKGGRRSLGRGSGEMAIWVNSLCLLSGSRSLPAGMPGRGSSISIFTDMPPDSDSYVSEVEAVSRQ